MANQQPSSTNFPPTKVATATLQPLTYYPLTPDELVSLSNLPVSRPAFLLLLYIKTNAPFGKPRRFTDSFNLRTMAAALKEFSRTTFWRARSQLVDKGLIELDDYSVRDSHTVNRQQFENSRRAKSAEVNVSEMLTLVSPVADLKRSLQACNERPLEPASSNSSDSYKQIKSISSNLNRKTTKHSQVPTSHPEVCFLADSSKIEERGQNDTAHFRLMKYSNNSQRTSCVNAQD